MKYSFLYGGGIANDFRRRLPFYASDWSDGKQYTYRLLAPATYIFFASAVPALAFGEQMTRETGGIMTGVQVLAATGATGLIQALLGGQPLLIVGVAEPIVLMYGYMYAFMQGKLPLDMFLVWAAWVNVWTAVMLFVLALVGSCKYISRFTRFSGELFGFLIAVLFIQQFVKGLVEGFRPEVQTFQNAPHSPESQQFPYLYINGIWSVFLGFGLLYTSWQLHNARRWIIGPVWFRNVLADYGVVSMVWLWTGISYSVKHTPSGTIRRLVLPNTWSYHSFWTVAGRMSELEGKWIAGAVVPAIIITILFYFDHSVSSQMAQRPEFNLRKPSAYNYDLCLLAVMTLACGLLGLPPVNGVLPQAPMHTERLGTMRGLQTRDRLAKAAKRSLARDPDNTKAALAEMAAEAKKLNSHADPYVQCAQSDAGTADADCHLDPDKLDAALDRIIPYEVAEQRWSGALQSGLVAACLAITPLLKFIPEAVLWGYFAYMGIASLPGSQFFERMVLLFSDPRQRSATAARWGHEYWEAVPLRVIAAFTAFQFVYVGLVYGLTWWHIVGSIFPVPILLLVPIRQFIMPWVFTEKYLNLLDPAGFVVEDKGVKKTLPDEELANGTPAANPDRTASAHGAASGDLDQAPGLRRRSESAHVKESKPAHVRQM
ncbi:hypothetical protein WJX73_004868 [Symbiochloris irregularis]|uniref:Bicarbonate transporter-like transmembrane domain-containing protein n=1 Tax=Symbiochloris irregularis TaxID=706552 RepID=A0AAW1NW76_9CHLO